MLKDIFNHAVVIVSATVASAIVVGLVLAVILGIIWTTQIMLG